jgi:hypothetical protein
MLVSTIRRAVGVAAIAAAFAALVPVAGADPGFQGSPDAIERSLNARQSELASGFQGNPDAIERALAAREALVTPSFQGSPDAMDQTRALDSAGLLIHDVVSSGARTESVASPVLDATEDVGSGGIDWSDFGLGAGLTLVLIGLGAGLIAIRRNHAGMKTA